MAYVKPQVLVFQEFSIVPTEITEPLRAHVSGPHAMLHRYADADEKALTRLGVYNSLAETCYAWPGRFPGSRIDVPYTKLYADNALLLYYEDTISNLVTTTRPVTNKNNWVESVAGPVEDGVAVYFKQNGGYNRSDVFKDRDVKLGDTVYLRSVEETFTGCIEHELWTSVAGFASLTTESEIEAATRDNVVNAGTTTLSVSSPTSGNDYLQIAGIKNCVRIASVNATNYDGVEDGSVSETYTVEVVKSSISGCNASVLRIRSASRLDDVTEVTAAAFASETTIGTRGLKVTFNLATSGCDAEALAAGVATDNFVVGQKWQVTVTQAFAAVYAKSNVAGAYTGDKNDTYIIECVRGGSIEEGGTSFPQIMVRTAKGLDFSGPTEITNSGTAPGDYFQIGSSGVAVAFCDVEDDPVTQMRKGDKWYVKVVASAAGPVNKLILKNDLPAAMRESYTLATTVHTAVRAATTENITLSGLQTVDSVAVVSGNRVLVKNQTIAAQNGIYVVPAASGSPATVGTWTRAADVLVSGSFVAVTSGTVNTNRGYLLTTTGTINVGSTALTWTRNDDANVAQTPVLDIRLYIKDDIQISKNRIGYAPLVNYELEPTQICVKDGVVAYHPEWTDNGVEQPLPLKGGTLYVEYREWLSELCDEINGINNVADLDQIRGPLDPDNPLKWGVYKALSNSNGTTVKYTAVCEPDDLDSWVQVLERIKGRDDLYNLVPLTFNKAVHDLYAAHINNESNEIANNWKAGFVAIPSRNHRLVVGEGAEISGVSGETISNPVLATVGDDPNATNTQYTRLQVPTGSGYFITNEVQPGDIVRYNFAVDGFGETEYQEYVVDTVLSENSLLLYSGTDTAMTTPQRVEIWHNLDRNELADDVATRAGALSNRRVCAVWPDQVGSAGRLMPGYYLAAALAGLASGVVPHQGLTNVEVGGFDDFTRSYKLFNETQLNRLAEAGVWIVTEDRDGTPYTRHALTTDNLDLNRREEMIRRNVDSISYLFLRRLRPYIGRTNATPTMVDKLTREVDQLIRFFKSNGYTEELGSQLIDGSVRILRIHPLLKDRIEIVLDLVVPAPLNNIELHLVV